MTIHVATLSLVKMSGNTLVTGTDTIKKHLNTTLENRVTPDAAIPNTASRPTVEAYLALEDAAGFSLAHFDQTYIITMDSSNGTIADAESSGLTFSTVIINEAVAGIADLGVAAAGEVVRLHKLKITMRGQGTAAIGYDDDGAGTNAVALEGPSSYGAGGGVLDPYNSDPRGALTTIADKHMTLTFVTAGGDGHAIISKGPA